MTMLSPTQRYNLRTRYLEVLIDEAAVRPAPELYDRIERLLELDRPQLVLDFRDILQSTPQRVEPASAAASFRLVDTPREGLDIPEDTAARPHESVGPMPRPGRTAAVPCTRDPNGYVAHRWTGLRDSDGWYRCANGCGAGRRYPKSGRVVAADEVPTLVVPAVPQPVSTAFLEEARASVALDGETQVWPPRDEPVEQLTTEDVQEIRDDLAHRDPHEIVEFPVIDESITPPGVDEGWGEFGAPTDTRLEEAFVDDVAGVEEQAVQDPPEDDDEDGEGVLRARGMTVDPASLAPLVGRDDTPENLTRTAPCTRCQTGQFARDPLEPNDPTAYACIVCGHRPRLSRSAAFALEQELRKPGKLRQRGASIGGMRI